MPQKKILNIIRSYSFYSIFQDYFHKRKYRKWMLSGKPIPTPHVVKQMTVKAYAAKYGTDIFVETGTYLGEMVKAIKYSFKKIYSIELSYNLYQKVENKFSKCKHIEIYNGDSSAVLPDILNRIHEPCLFWLDAHYSEGITEKGEKETPIIEELEHIFSHLVKNHVILIDDARCFTGQSDYPSLKDLKQYIANQSPFYSFHVADDIIRICTNKNLPER